MSAHAAVNESVSIQVLTVLTAEHDVALQRFLRQIHASHLYAELVQPLLSSSTSLSQRRIGHGLFGESAPRPCTASASLFSARMTAQC